jgi:hypothetical protein
MTLTIIPIKKVAIAAYGTMIPKRTRKSNAQTPTQGIKISVETAKPENRMLMMKFINDYLSSKLSVNLGTSPQLECWNTGIME